MDGKRMSDKSGKKEYMKKIYPAFCVAAVLSVASAGLNLSCPMIISKIAGLIAEGAATTIDIKGVSRLALIAAVFYALVFVCNFVQSLIMSKTALKMAKDIRSRLSNKLDRLPLKYFDGTTSGNILSRFSNDVDTLSQGMSQSFGVIILATASIIGSVIMMLITNWIMALAGILATLTGFALMRVILKYSNKFFISQQEYLGRLNGHIDESYTGHTVIRAYNGVKSAENEFLDVNSRLYDNEWRSQFYSGMIIPMMTFTGNLGYVVVCITGAVLVLMKVTGIEVIVAFMLYIRLFASPLSQIAQAAGNMQSANAASRRIFEFLSEEEMSGENDTNDLLERARGEVEFSHVRFSYDGERTIIHDFSAKAEPGNKIAIVGPTGAGKTTMVNLLMRFYDADSGRILIDGHSVTDMTRENVHEQFCMVLQDTWLFEGTVYENVRYSKLSATREDVIKACKAVGLHNFIMTLPQGYDTVITDADCLSAGQKQLMTIARAMVEDAPMLILDEATSSVDTRTEAVIQAAMDELMKGRTSFVIAHRLSTIVNADMILVMKDGDVIEKGTHKKLMEKGGFYADLYNSQFMRIA